MQNKVANSKKSFSWDPKNTVETLKGGVFDQFFGTKETYEDQGKKPSFFNQRKEQNLFKYSEYHEKEIVKKQIVQLVEQIRKEIECIKKADKSLLNEVKDIENLTLNSLPEKPGIYHVRFLEVVLRLLQSIRAKVGESRTWLQAMMSKKKKRGSLFTSLSKKKGTQYSLSQELNSARSVQ